MYSGSIFFDMVCAQHHHDAYITIIYINLYGNDHHFHFLYLQQLTSEDIGMMPGYQSNEKKKK